MAPQGLRKKGACRNERTVSADHPGPPTIRPFPTSLLKRSRHLILAAGHFKKLVTGTPAVGRDPLSPRKPSVNLQLHILKGHGLARSGFLDDGRASKVGKEVV